MSKAVPNRAAVANPPTPDGNAMIRRSRLSASERTLGAVGAFGNHDLVWTGRHTSGATLGCAGWYLGATTIDYDVEARVPAERDREQVEELGVATRDHDQVVRHPIRVISADGEWVIRVTAIRLSIAPY